MGCPVEGELQPGDLMFYGEPDPDHNRDRQYHITHVTISLGGQRVLHSTGAFWGVVYNSLDPDSAEYRDWLREHYVGARRFTSC
jgi:cell wall-associated NlpC family hydrolase